MSVIMAAMSADCFILMGLYLEAASIQERIYLYLFPNKVSLGM